MRPIVRRTPVATRLSETKILAGGEFKLVMANIAFGFIVVALLHVWQYFLVAALMHVALMITARNDSKAREIYLEYVRQGDRYVPWPEPRQQQRSRRPMGYARNEVL